MPFKTNYAYAPPTWMRQAPPHAVAPPRFRPLPPKRDAPESEHAKYQAVLMDHQNMKRWSRGLPPEFPRARYPDGWGPGQSLVGPVRAQLAEFVDAADPAEVEDANCAARAEFMAEFIAKYGDKELIAKFGADAVARMLKGDSD